MRFFVLIFAFLFAFASALSAGEAFEAVKDGIQGAIDDVKEGFEEFKVILLFEKWLEIQYFRKTLRPRSMKPKKISQK